LKTVVGIRYATNAIGVPLPTGHRPVRRFQETGQFTRRPGSGRKRAITHRNDRFLNNNGVPLFLKVGVQGCIFKMCRNFTYEVVGRRRLKAIKKNCTSKIKSFYFLTENV
jgi:hypothetical protein